MVYACWGNGCVYEQNGNPLSHDMQLSTEKGGEQHRYKSKITNIKP